MCQVTAVVMEATQLVLGQFKNFFIVFKGELNKVFVLKIISERCELVKLCHINCCGPVFLDTCIWFTITSYGMNTSRDMSQISGARIRCN